MTYKKFQDWYHQANIKHLLLYEHDGYLISPPFATKRCEDYNKIMKYDGTVSYIDTELPKGTSKTNSVINVDGSSWFIPYAIYDEFNTLLELKNETVIHHKLESSGKGQFYSGASNGTVGFSFPLGYEGTQYALLIKNNSVNLLPFTHTVSKAHMGTVYCNGKFYSMPRGDEPNYNNLVSYDGEKFEEYYVSVEAGVTRKFTDLIAVGNKLYSLPFGETSGLNEAIEFDTETKTFNNYKLDVVDFPKKFNCMVLLDDTIIGLPYGDKNDTNSRYGVIFDTVTKTNKSFDIGLTFGGKYRYRCGITFNNLAWFFPGGSPSCPIIVVDKFGKIIYERKFKHLMFGRPIVYKEKIYALAYEIESEKQMLYTFDTNFNITVIDI